MLWTLVHMALTAIAIGALYFVCWIIADNIIAYQEGPTANSSDTGCQTD